MWDARCDTTELQSNFIGVGDILRRQHPTVQAKQRYDWWFDDDSQNRHINGHIYIRIALTAEITLHWPNVFEYFKSELDIHLHKYATLTIIQIHHG